MDRQKKIDENRIIELTIEQLDDGDSFAVNDNYVATLMIRHLLDRVRLLEEKSQKTVHDIKNIWQELI